MTPYHRQSHTVRARSRSLSVSVAIPTPNAQFHPPLACGFAVCPADNAVMLDPNGSTDPEVSGRGGHGTPRRRPGSADLAAGNGLLHIGFIDLRRGYQASRRHVLPVLESTTPTRSADAQRRSSDRSEIQTLIGIGATATGMRVEEVASIEHLRTHGIGDRETARAGRRVLSTIVGEFRRRTAGRRTVAARTVAAHRAATPQPAPVVTLARAGRYGAVETLLDAGTAAASGRLRRRGVRAKRGAHRHNALADPSRNTGSRP